MNKIKLKNITIIASTTFPFGTANANLIRNLSLGLVMQGCNIHLLISKGVDSIERGNGQKRNNVYRGIEYSYCSFIKKPSIYLLKILDVLIGLPVILSKLVFKKYSSNVDAVLIYTGYAYQNFPILIFCKLLNIPVFKYSVDYYNKKSIVKKWWLLPKWWLFKVEIGFLDKYLDGIIAISGLLYKHYLDIEIPEKKLIIIPNILDFERFEDAKATIKKNNNIRIGYSGAAPLLNGVDDLIKAFKMVRTKHNNTELLIIGDVVGKGTQLPLLKKVAEDNKVLDYIVFKGRIPGQEVPDYLASCDILVLARKNTQYAQAGFPTKLGEYFASGKPVVMTAVGDIKTYFTHKGHLMIAEPDQPESLANSINYLIENPDKAVEISNNGFQWAKENLDYLKTSKKIYEFILSNLV